MTWANHSLAIGSYNPKHLSRKEKLWKTPIMHAHRCLFLSSLIKPILCNLDGKPPGSCTLNNSDIHLKCLNSGTVMC